MIGWIVATALAQDQTFDPERFDPQSDAHGYAVVEGAATLEHLQAMAGLWANHSQDSLVMVRDGVRVPEGVGEADDGVLDQRTQMDLQAGIGISRYFSLSASLPVVLWQEGYDPNRLGGPPGSADLVASGLGDLRLNPKFVFLDLDDVPVGLAVVARVSVPMGDGASFLGEGNVTAEPTLVVEVSDGSIHARSYRIRAALNAGYHIRPITQWRDLTLGSEFVYRGGLAVHPAAPLELGCDIAGALGGPQAAKRPLEVLPWLRLLPVKRVTLTAGAGFGILPGVGSPDLRLWGAATLAPSFDPKDRDTDKDGVFNDVDNCKFEPEDRDGFEDEDGCPEIDNDRDGILDATDRCPVDPEDPDGYEDADGCPDLDNDGDGILDTNDRCPDQPENKNGVDDLDGCPDRDRIGDADRDGLLDNVDRCPQDPEDFDEFEDADGCPDRDNDSDGILDGRDACPNDRETFNAFEDEDGCPDEAPPLKPARVVVEKTRIRIDEMIQFEVNRAVIRPESFGLMSEITTVILDHPEITNIRIEGHTDSDGSDAYNLKLSQGRAEAVAQWLIQAGVDPTRLDAVGFGEARPITANDSPESKAINRRVEFLIVSQE